MTIETNENVQETTELNDVTETPIESGESTPETTDPVSPQQEPTDETQAPAEETQEKPLTQEEFNKLYFEKKQAERDRAALEAKIAELSQTKPQAKPSQEVNKTLEDFDFDDAAYQDYIIEQKVEAKLAARAQQEQESQAKTAQEQAAKQVTDGFNAKAHEYAAKNPSYNDAMANAQHVVYSPTLSEAVLHEGPALDHHLLTNPQLVDKLNGLSGYALAKEVAVITTNLSKAVATKTSKAPVPPPVVTGGSRSHQNPDEMSMQDYYAAEQARLEAKAKNR